MERKHYTDDELIEMIRRAGNGRKEALHFAYISWRSSAKAILVAAGAPATDAEDAIQEAIVVLDNNIRNGKYHQAGSLKNYFIGICKGRLYSNRRSTRRIEWTSDNWKMDGIEARQPETLMLEEEEKTIIRKMLDKMDEKCRQVLRLYKLSYSMKEIAEAAGLGNDNNARQRVHKCRKKMKELMAENPLFANYFKDQP